MGKKQLRHSTSSGHADEQEAVLRAFPSLGTVRDGDETWLVGSLPIEWQGELLDSFSVEIKISSLDDNKLPLVRETGGRIPRTVDRHVNFDGSACVTLPEDYFLKYPGPFKLLEFLQGPVRDYFMGQALVSRGEPWPHSEWPHYTEGRLQFFRELLGTDDPVKVKCYLLEIERPMIRGHLPCPCGSGKKLRKCHQSQLAVLRGKIRSSAARRLLALLSANPLISK